MKHIYSNKDLGSVEILEDIAVHYCGKKDDAKAGLFGGLNKRELTLIHVVNKTFVKDNYLLIGAGTFNLVSAMDCPLSKEELKKYNLNNKK